MSEWKETDFGRIPINWELKPIIELKSFDKRAIAMGPFGSDIKAENFIDEGVPVIRGTNFNYDKYIDGDFVFLTDNKADELIGSNCKPNDIVFTHRGTIGQVALIPKNSYKRYVISQSGMKLTVNNTLINYEFLFYFFKSKYGQFQILKYESQVGVPSISNPLTSLKEIEVPVPPLPVQKAIAEVLSSLDDKIDLLHRQNKTLEQMAETLFRQWFVPARAGEPHAGGEEAKEDWEKTKVKDFDVIVTDYVANGSFASLAENVNYKSEPDYAILIRLTDYNHSFNNDFVYVDKRAYDFLEKSKLQGGEIIISNVGAYSGTVFKCPKLNRPMTLGPNSIVLKSEFNNYFFLLFRSTYGKFILDGIISGSAQPKFNKTAFRNIYLQYPSIEYISKFEKTVKPYFEKIDFNSIQIRTLEKTRDTLLPKLMSGEVRVCKGSPCGYPI
ncbi:MAG: restriction endonuclease subunit S [Bacteroidota bacterium]|nr:restriction endonuclease subunit S [Bacteroidota bacterium]